MDGAIAAKILWREGMHLAQHHFQSQSRYVEDCIATALSHSFFTPYGLAGCELDTDALRNGTAALLFARGLMADGTPFQMPDGDPLPAPRDIRDAFSPATDSHKLLLALPPYRATGANLAADGDGARFRAITRVQRDDLTGTDERSVTLAGRNFRLILDSEATEGVVALSLAVVRRDGKGHGRIAHVDCGERNDEWTCVGRKQPALVTNARTQHLGAHRGAVHAWPARRLHERGRK